MSPQEHRDVPLELQRQIDAHCRDFERQWCGGKIPRLEEYVSKISAEGRRLLLKELVIIESNYRRDAQGKKPDVSELCGLHPDLCREIVELLGSPAVENGEKTTVVQGEVTANAAKELFEPAPAFKPQQGSSRGLHIRCPHCSNPVELLSDTSFDSITCETCGSAFSLINENEATQQAPILKQIGRFEIVGRLGVGGFGTVWKARDPELERAVAIKIPRKGQLDRDEIEDFLKEARTAAQLHHPHIVPVYEVGKDGDTVFIVSQLIRGVSLSDWLSGAKPDFRQIAELLARVADALDHAHKKGVIHRDLKPSNILIDENGQPNVMDFGLAKRDGLEITMTVDGQVLGTPAYMSPEQAAGKSNWTDCRMDIYSFGVVLFRMLTGELPYRGNAQMQIHQRLTQDAPDPRGLNRYIPRDLATICLKCLERDPNGRYSTAKQIAEELGRFLRGEPIVARPISHLERTIRWAKRNPWLATAGVLTAILAVGGPATAVVIEGLRQRQVELDTERTNLIDRMGEERTQLVDEKSALQEELNVWKGQANPWKIWPPKSAQSPQKSLLEEIMGVSDAIESKWQSASNPLDVAYVNLAIAAMYDELAQPDRAVTHYSQALQALETLRAKEPNTRQYVLAYANGLKQLARLTVDSDRQQAAAYLTKAELALKSIPGSQDAASQVELLEAHLDLAILPGFETAGARLTEAEQLKNGFSKGLPKSPKQFYQLVCLLANRVPLLTFSHDDAEGARDERKTSDDADANDGQ